MNLRATAARVLPPSRRLLGDRRWRFLGRWVAAVALSMLAVGAVEYVVAAEQLERRTVDGTMQAYVMHAEGIEKALASAPAGALERQEGVEEHLAHITVVPGTTGATLFDAQGRAVAAADEGADDGEAGATVDPEKVREVLSSLRPLYVAEHNEGETGDGQFEFLVPVRSPEGWLILEAEQHAEVLEGLLTDLRERTVISLLLTILMAGPLSYALGGHALHRRQRKAERAAATDALTGLAGRRPFRPALEAALSTRRRGAVSLALIDVDEFKQVNDRLGHSYGDRVLTALAESFRVLRASDTAYRLGGDEFAVVLPGTDEVQAAEVVERVRRAFATKAPGVTLSCGIASARSSEVLQIEELWERSDAALYEAKRRGRRRTVLFSSMSAELTGSVDKLDAVAALLGVGTPFTVAFQPIWDLRHGTVLGHEALLRLPPGSPISGPHEAFELAQRLGLAAELDQRARDAVLRSVSEQRWEGSLFVNVHPDALLHLNVDALVADVAAAGLEPRDVVLEVTEHAGLDNSDALRTLKAAHRAGFRLALDDMGQGNSGLRALTRVRFDVVKLDRGVVARLGTDPASDATVAAATTFVRRTGGWIIAEGIEDVDVLAAVTEAPGDAASARPPVLAGQGYLLGRPAADPVAIDADLGAMVARRDGAIVAAGSR